MKSPTLQVTIIAVILAVITYFVEPTAIVAAGFVFISAFIASIFSDSSPTKSKLPTSNGNLTDEDVSTLYVGNLPYRANETSVRDLFSNHGKVHSVRLMKDKHTGKRRGFGFVEMASGDLNKAISALNDSEFQQRTLKVREAKERPERVDENNTDD